MNSIAAPSPARRRAFAPTGTEYAFERHYNADLRVREEGRTGDEQADTHV
jgi:hypothetical protein